MTFAAWRTGTGAGIAVTVPNLLAARDFATDRRRDRASHGPAPSSDRMPRHAPQGHHLRSSSNRSSGCAQGQRRFRADATAASLKKLRCGIHRASLTMLPGRRAGRALLGIGTGFKLRLAVQHGRQGQVIKVTWRVGAAGHVLHFSPTIHVTGRTVRCSLSLNDERGE